MNFLIQNHVIIYVLLNIVFISGFILWQTTMVSPAAFPGHMAAIRNKKSWVDNAVAVVVILLIVACWAVNIFYWLDYRHNDEVGYLNSIIYPTMYSGRFFPLGHLEFNLLNLSYFGGNLVYLYMLPLLQGLICIYLLMRICPFKSRGLSALCVGFVFVAVLAVPFSNVIIPERNAIFLLLISLFFYYRFLSNQKKSDLVISLVSCGFSLYYKEPMFALYVSFSIMAMILRRKSRTDVRSRCRSIGAMPIECGYIILSAFFLIGYYFYVLFQSPPTELYGFQPRSYVARIEDLLLAIPYLPCVAAIYFGYLWLPYGSREKFFGMPLLSASLGYAGVLVVIGLPTNGYYYSIPFLTLFLSAMFLLSGLNSKIMNKSVQV